MISNIVFIFFVYSDLGRCREEVGGEVNWSGIYKAEIFVAVMETFLVVLLPL